MRINYPEIESLLPIKNHTMMNHPQKDSNLAQFLTLKSHPQITQTYQSLTQNQNPYYKFPNTKCFRCMRFGHWSNECPQHSSTNLVENCELSEDGIEAADNDLDDAEPITGDEGEHAVSFIVQEILLSTTHVVPWRHVLFKTRCTI